MNMKSVLWEKEDGLNNRAFFVPVKVDCLPNSTQTSLLLQHKFFIAQ